MAKIKLQPTKMSDVEYIEYIKAKFRQTMQWNKMESNGALIGRKQGRPGQERAA